MTAEQFAYWLQGFSEIHREPPTAEQWQVIRDHLATVFTKVTPNREGRTGQADVQRSPSMAEILAQTQKPPQRDRLFC